MIPTPEHGESILKGMLPCMSPGHTGFVPEITRFGLPHGAEVLLSIIMKPEKFRDYVDPDGEMEIDLFPDDGVVHDITTGVSHADGILWVGTYFGLSRYDGARWKGYFDHDSGLLSNFINFLKADRSVVFLCTDKGLSSFNGDTWVGYQRNENNYKGKVLITSGEETKEIDASTSISHNFVIGVDTQGDEIWIATSKGVSRGERIK